MQWGALQDCDSRGGAGSAGCIHDACASLPACLSSCTRAELALPAPASSSRHPLRALSHFLQACRTTCSRWRPSSTLGSTSARCRWAGCTTTTCRSSPPLSPSRGRCRSTCMPPGGLPRSTPASVPARQAPAAAARAAPCVADAAPPRQDHDHAPCSWGSCRLAASRGRMPAGSAALHGLPAQLSGRAPLCSRITPAGPAPHHPHPTPAALPRARCRPRAATRATNSTTSS